jgi:hypothetical protein
MSPKMAPGYNMRKQKEIFVVHRLAGKLSPSMHVRAGRMIRFPFADNEHRKPCLGGEEE